MDCSNLCYSSFPTSPIHNHDILSTFYSAHRFGTQSPSNDELAHCLKDLFEIPGQAPVYLIVDALDECPNTSDLLSPREKVLMFLQRPFRLKTPEPAYMRD